MVNDIPAGDRKTANLSLQCGAAALPYQSVTGASELQAVDSSKKRRNEMKSTESFMLGE
jgi:hypothetical protein